MKTFKSNIIFCFLAFFLTWFWIFLYSAGQANIIPFKISSVYISLFGAFGPSLAGIISICLFTGKEGLKKTLKNLINFRIAFKYYLIVLFFEMIIFIIIITAGAILNIQKPEINLNILITSSTGFLYNVLFCSLISGLGEELGWRGFFLPNLQLKLSPLIASLIISIIVSLWHLKSYALAELLKGNNLMFLKLFLPDMGQRILITIPVIFIITYLFNKTGGSLLIMVLFHGSSNASFEWAKEIYAYNLPDFFFPAFIIILWIISLFFIPLLVKQRKKGEIINLEPLLKPKYNI